MDTNTIIELFEELRKQLTSLSRRIDDRNISAPAPVTTDGTCRPHYNYRKRD